jgi:hypothetical protein
VVGLGDEFGIGAGQGVVDHPHEPGDARGAEEGRAGAAVGHVQGRVREHRADEAPGFLVAARQHGEPRIGAPRLPDEGQFEVADASLRARRRGACRIAPGEVAAVDEDVFPVQQAGQPRDDRLRGAFGRRREDHPARPRQAGEEVLVARGEQGAAGSVGSLVTGDGDEVGQRDGTGSGCSGRPCRAGKSHISGGPAIDRKAFSPPKHAERQFPCRCGQPIEANVAAKIHGELPVSDFTQ